MSSSSSSSSRPSAATSAHDHGNNPLKAAATQFLRGVQEQQRHDEEEEERRDNPSSWSVPSSDDEEAATTPSSKAKPTTTTTTDDTHVLSDLEERETLVSRDTQWVRLLRGMVLVAVLLLGGTTAWVTFEVVQESDHHHHPHPRPADPDGVFRQEAQSTLQRLQHVQRVSHALGQAVTASVYAANGNTTTATFSSLLLGSNISAEWERQAAEALETTPAVRAILIASLERNETMHHGPDVDTTLLRESGGDIRLPVMYHVTTTTDAAATFSSSGPHDDDDDLTRWHASVTHAAQLTVRRQRPVWSGVLENSVLMTTTTPREEEDDASSSYSSFVMVPVQDHFGRPSTEDDHPRTVGFVVAFVDWGRLLERDTSDSSGSGNDHGDEHVVVDWTVRSECEDDATTAVSNNGKHIVPLREDTLNGHDDDRNHWELTLIYHPSSDNAPAIRDDGLEGLCLIQLSVDEDLYLTTDDRDQSLTTAIVSSCAVGLVFLGILVLFAVYDARVSRRQVMLLGTATKLYKIVSGLFPKIVKDRMMSSSATTNGVGDKDKTRTDASQGGLSSSYHDAPIADLFPETTILFADIVGFTAWSSMREPSQVFILLESLFTAYDELAQRYGVFKVETVGDCYVAACGVPDPCKDHAVAMARFAVRCAQTMHHVTKNLELSLGPDTTDLDIRIGLHSGAVTAGVLRGERARFQLFGDTMNTAARIESNGAPGKIHISQETADLLRQADKSSWIRKRDDAIIAKGKGVLNTFWLAYQAPRKVGSKQNGAESDVMDLRKHLSKEAPLQASAFGVRTEDFVAPEERRRRLIEYNKDVLIRLLRRVVAARRAKYPGGVPAEEELLFGQSKAPVEEVAEVIEIPNEVCDAEASDEVSEAVSEQLELYISDIAVMYRDNPFHNFEHASHVAMSVVKLMHRIVDAKGASHHDYAYGFSSDPLTQFACVFSALVHDVDHTGAPNNQLNKEGGMLAKRYSNKSVAEQNSIDIAWNLLSCPEFGVLRQAIMPIQSEQCRFRQLLVNSVMATDIMDKDLKNARNARWKRAFKTDVERALDDHDEPESIVRNRKATIVIEHLIQASDVAHTMQHWHIYRKWNERLFAEMLRAYLAGRAEKHPVEYWYQGEIGFFDFYIIPLAKKLKECGVFGVSSDEYLNYALKNREEWVAKGRGITAEVMARVYLHK